MIPQKVPARCGSLSFELPGLQNINTSLFFVNYSLRYELDVILDFPNSKNRRNNICVLYKLNSLKYSSIIA
jgi:hypothetical protein